MEGRTGLYRSTHDTMIGGVAAGLAEYLNIDPTLVRIIFILLVLVGGGGLILYIILWIVLPTDQHILSSPKNQNPMEEHKNPEAEKHESLKHDPRFKKKDDGSLIAGLILITLGVIFLVIRYFPRIDFGDLWPVILIVVGIVLLRNAFVSNKK